MGTLKAETDQSLLASDALKLKDRTLILMKVNRLRSGQDCSVLCVHTLLFKSREMEAWERLGTLL